MNYLQEINDLAYHFVQAGKNPDTMHEWVRAEAPHLTHDELEFFPVFVKHWLDNHRGMAWSDAIMLYDENQRMLCK